MAELREIVVASGRLGGALETSIPSALLEVMERSRQTALAVDANMLIGYLNPSWYGFMCTSGALISTGLGDNVLDAITTPTREEYADLFNSTLRSGEVASRDYHCACPDAFRLFHVDVYPLPVAAGLAMVHSLRIELKHTGPAADTETAAYRDGLQIVRQCSQCKRYQRVDDQDRWDWVTEWAVHCPPQTSHTLCDLCLEHHYPEEGY